MCCTCGAKRSNKQGAVCGLLAQLKDEFLEGYALGVLYADEQVAQLREKELDLLIAELAQFLA